MRVRVRWLALVALLVGGCATGVPIQNAADLGGEWKGRVTSPLGHAAATLTVAPWSSESRTAPLPSLP